MLLEMCTNLLQIHVFGQTGEYCEIVINEFSRSMSVSVSCILIAWRKSFKGVQKSKNCRRVGWGLFTEPWTRSLRTVNKFKLAFDAQYRIVIVTFFYLSSCLFFWLWKCWSYIHPYMSWDAKAKDKMYCVILFYKRLFCCMELVLLVPCELVLLCCMDVWSCELNLRNNVKWHRGMGRREGRVGPHLTFGPWENFPKMFVQKCNFVPKNHQFWENCRSSSVYFCCSVHVFIIVWRQIYKGP